MLLYTLHPDHAARAHPLTGSARDASMSSGILECLEFDMSSVGRGHFIKLRGY